MAKEIIAITIIVFWVIFPFGVALQNLDIEGFKQLDYNESLNLNEPSSSSTCGGNTVCLFGESLNDNANLWHYVKIYFKAMYMTIPNVPPIITLFIVIMQLISGLVVYLLLRGG